MALLTSTNSRSKRSCLQGWSCWLATEGELLRDGGALRSSERRTLRFRSHAVSYWWRARGLVMMTTDWGLAYLFAPGSSNMALTVGSHERYVYRVAILCRAVS
jgi:hypothetical protein